MPGRVPGAYIPEVLDSHHDSSGYYRPFRGFYSLSEGIRGNFELVGRPKKPAEWVSLSSLTRAQRLFPSIPRTCGDLLSNRYYSVMREVEAGVSSSTVVK